MADKVFLRDLAGRIEQHLMKIETILGPDYKLTLIARNTTKEAADVILSIDDMELAVAALRRTQANGVEVAPCLPS